MRSFRFSLAVIFSLALAGCSSSSTPDSSNNNGVPANAAASPTPVASQTTAPSPAQVKDETPDDTADFKGTAGITEKKNPNVTAVAVLNDVRSARHGNYDRLVFEFKGKELPTYHIEYIDKPVRACGSGDVVPFAGDAWLEVRFTDAQAHTPEGNPTIKDRTRSPNLPVVKDLKITCDFEAEVTWVAGMSSPNRYRVLELRDPTRLAIDIRHNQK